MPSSLVDTINVLAQFSREIVYRYTHKHTTLTTNSTNRNRIFTSCTYISQ